MAPRVARRSSGKLVRPGQRGTGMRYEANPPDAASLMLSARSFGNYDLPGALADLIDNSIKARAREVWLTCDFNDGAPEIRIRDDGEGLIGAQLRSASRGAQKCFLDYAKRAGKAWEISEAGFNERWFRGVVAKAILFRWTDRMVGTSVWYQEDRGYKAQVVTYSLAWMVNRLREQDSELDLNLVWQRQEVPDGIASVLLDIAPQVATAIRRTPSQVKNVGEWCKQHGCWDAVAALQSLYKGTFAGVVVCRTATSPDRRDGTGAERPDAEQNLDHATTLTIANAASLAAFAAARGLTTPKSDAALRRLMRGDGELPVPESNALKYLLARALRAGFEMDVDRLTDSTPIRAGVCLSRR